MTWRGKDLVSYPLSVTGHHRRAPPALAPHARRARQVRLAAKGAEREMEESQTEAPKNQQRRVARGIPWYARREIALIERNVARIRTTIAALKTARDTSATRNMRMIVVASMAARVTAERGARYERGAARKDHRVALNDAARDRAADAVAAPLQVPFFRAANERLLAEIEARLTGHVFPPEEHILWKVRDWRPCHTSLDFAAAASTLLVGSLPAHTRTHVRRWRPSTTQRNPPP